MGCQSVCCSSGPGTSGKKRSEPCNKEKLFFSDRHFNTAQKKNSVYVRVKSVHYRDKTDIFMKRSNVFTPGCFHLSLSFSLCLSLLQCLCVPKKRSSLLTQKLVFSLCKAKLRKRPNKHHFRNIRFDHKTALFFYCTFWVNGRRTPMAFSRAV